MKGLFLIFFYVCMGFAYEVVLSGSVVSDDERYITGRNMGFVTSVSVNEGDNVKKGDTLYTIDAKEIDAQRVQVELQVEQAKLSQNMYQNQLNTVSLNHERYKRLYEKDMVSKYELENLELHKKNLEDMVSIAKKQVSQAEQQLKVVKNQYEYHRIKSPVDGIVRQKNIKAGEMAIPGMPAMIISSKENLKVVTDLPESLMPYVKKGERVKVVIDTIGFVGEGVVESVVDALNPMTHSTKAKVALDSNDAIYPGMYAKIIIERGE